MDKERRREFDEYRLEQASEIENTVIDELVDGVLDRSEFIRRATMLGMSLPAVGAALAALGHPSLAFGSPARQVAGGRLKVGIIPPPTTTDPYTYADIGGLATGSIPGEFLIRATQSLALVPELALSWKPNKTGSVWRYKLRKGVKFQSGQPFNADAVLATFKRLVSDPKSTAGSAFKGVLAPSGIKKVDAHTVDFHLEAPTGHFPYLTSSTTYQAILLPADYELDTFTKKAQATGAFMLSSYTPGVGAKFDRFPGWWGGHAALDGVDVTYFSTDAATSAALLGKTQNLIGQINYATQRPLIGNKNVKVFDAAGATHREVCMRVDLSNPLKDWRVRQAIALTLDRPAIVKTLFGKYAALGNDSPFAPAFVSTNKSVPQRHKDIRKAKQLMAAAGFPNGFSITLTTEQVGEIPQLAQIIQRSVRAIGIKMKLQILTSSQYFAGTSTGPPNGWGTTPWLNTPMNITDWGARAVPDVLLTAAFHTKGVWNAAHYSNKKLDRLMKSYFASVSLKDQQRYAGQMQRILLHDTPVIIPYFYDYLGAGTTNVKGYHASGQGTIFLSHTSLS